MHSMTQDQPLVIGGVDAHADTHHFAALDYHGALLATKAFPASTPGYAEALDWLRGFGSIHAVAIESTGSYASALVRYLREHAIEVREVNQPHAAHTRRRAGKSDPIDAEMAARLLLAGKATATPKQTTGIVEAIRVLRVTRNSAVKARSAALVQVRDLLITAPQPLRDQLAARRSLPARPPSAHASGSPSSRDHWAPRSARSDQSRSGSKRSTEKSRRSTTTSSDLSRPLVQLLGISTGHAGQMLITAGQNIERFHGEASFAAICGASPVPASSGKTVRHRLNPGGDRQANRALHLIAVCRLRYCQRTHAYAQRRVREGKSQREIMRCLKRYIAREIYNTLRADLNDLAPPPPQQTTTILCGSPGFGITRRRT
jgi:transposase